MDKPFSQACANNQKPISEALREYFKSKLTVLEIGSGTGQHACYLAEHFPSIAWQPSDRSENLEGISAWVSQAGLSNLHNPIELDVTTPPALTNAYDALFTANTLHIMPEKTVEVFFSQIPTWLNPGGFLFTYGPFRYKGAYTSESNTHFDVHLKQWASHQGIRDIEWITELANSVNLELVCDHSMPANNQLLVWKQKGIVR